MKKAKYSPTELEEMKKEAIFAAREGLNEQDGETIRVLGSGLINELELLRLRNGFRDRSTGLGDQGQTELIGKLGMYLVLREAKRTKKHGL
jgi:hypothetical protein